MVQLGDEVKDTVTGFKGTAVAITEWLHGCRRVLIQPVVDKDGKHVDSYQVDEPQVQVLTPKAVERGSNDTGGPAPKPTPHGI
jgi:hypothetical protein